MNQQPALETLLDSEAVALIFGRTSRYVRILVQRGVLPVVRIPGSRALRFRPETVRRFMEENEQLAKVA